MSSGIITLTKCDANLVGISIGGGAPLCPHVYIVQVFDNTPAAIDQTLESGDRIMAVNNFDVNGRTKLEVARMIQNAGVSQISNCSFIGFLIIFCVKIAKLFVKKIVKIHRGCQQLFSYFAQKLCNSCKKIVKMHRQQLG